MRQLLDSLIEKNTEQSMTLRSLLEILEEEKEVMKKNNPGMLPGLLERFQEISGKAMLAEAERRKAAEAIASKLECRPVVTDICRVLDPDESNKLRSSAKELLSTVVSIREISFVISRQAEEHRYLGEMILERLRNATLSSQQSCGLDRRA